MVLMQFVQLSQISHRRYLQEIEIIFAGITETGDVAIHGGTPTIVLATAMQQQVVSPGKCTRNFYRLRSHGTQLLKAKMADELLRSAPGWNKAPAVELIPHHRPRHCP